MRMVKNHEVKILFLEMLNSNHGVSLIILLLLWLVYNTFALKKVDKSIHFHFKAGDYKRQNGEDMKIHPVRKSLFSSHKER